MPTLEAQRRYHKRDQLSKDNRKIGGWPEGFDPFYGAPVILMAFGRKDWPTYVYDGSLVMGNMMLAAHSLGLGSIWIHRAKEESEMPEYQELLKSLGIEGQWEGIGHCAVGYIDGDMPEAADRKDRQRGVESEFFEYMRLSFRAAFSTYSIVAIMTSLRL